MSEPIQRSDVAKPSGGAAGAHPAALPGNDDLGAVRFRRAFLLILVVGISVLFLWMIRGFLIAVFLAAVTAGIAQPLYRWLLTRMGGRRVPASLLTIAILLLGIVAPLSGFLALVAAQAVEIGQDIASWVQEEAEGRIAQLETFVRGLPLVGGQIPAREELAIRAEALGSAIGGFLLGTAAAATRGTLSFFLQLFILLYSLFFFLIGGSEILRRILSYTPLRPDEEEALLERFVSVTRATLKGSLLIGVIQGAVAGIAFWIAGVPGAAFWGTVMVVLSIIPAVGSALVWIPAVIYLYLAGQTVAATGLLAWCAVVVSSIDNLLRPPLVGRDARMSDLMILLSTLGGILLFGAVGFVVGPIIAALFVTTWHIYGEAFRGWLPKEPGPVLVEPPPVLAESPPAS